MAGLRDIRSARKRGDGWNHLWQEAVGFAWGRERSFQHLSDTDPGVAAVILAELTR
jgi:hypothetical protein